jgi:amidohydrolase
MKNLYQILEENIAALALIAKQHREHFHKYPELSGKEVKTSSYIAETLKQIGIENIEIFPNLGVTALIQGQKQSIVVGIRAEMDALPVDEANDVAYASQNKGVMHACGHDVHMGIALALVDFFYQNRDLLNVSLKFIFQPSEETLPGGAFQMIEHGVLENPHVDMMMGMHVLPEMKAGNVGFRKGIYMASSDEIYLTLIGKGGHAAMPHLLNDPVVCAAQIITSVQQVISRRASPEIPSVLSFGRCIANGRTNVIPDVVEIEGTFRTFDEQWREKAHKLVKDIAVNTAESADIVADINIIKGYPVLKNNAELTEKVSQAVTIKLGKNAVEELPLRMTADDFAYYTQKAPSCYFRIGVGNPTGETIRNLHTPVFDVHDDVFATGLKAMTAAVESLVEM